MFRSIVLEKDKKISQVVPHKKTTEERGLKGINMIKNILLSVLLLFAFGCTSNYESSNKSHFVGGDGDGGCSVERILFAGDSLTAGANTPGKDGFRRSAIAVVKISGIPFEVVGAIAGEAGFLDYPLNLHEGHGSYALNTTDPDYSFPMHLPTWVSNADPTIVVLLVGTVDNAIGYSPSITIPIVRTLIENISNSGARKIVLVRNFPQYPPSNGTLTQISLFNTALSSLATTMVSEGHKIVVVDPGVYLEPACMFDGIHVTDELCADTAGIVIGNGIVAAHSL